MNKLILTKSHWSAVKHFLVDHRTKMVFTLLLLLAGLIFLYPSTQLYLLSAFFLFSIGLGEIVISYKQEIREYLNSYTNRLQQWAKKRKSFDHFFKFFVWSLHHFRTSPLGLNTNLLVLGTVFLMVSTYVPIASTWFFTSGLFLLFFMAFDLSAGYVSHAFNSAREDQNQELNQLSLRVNQYLNGVETTRHETDTKIKELEESIDKMNYVLLNLESHQITLKEDVEAATTGVNKKVIDISLKMNQEIDNRLDENKEILENDIQSKIAEMHKTISSEVQNEIDAIKQEMAEARDNRLGETKQSISDEVHDKIDALQASIPMRIQEKVSETWKTVYDDSQKKVEAMQAAISSSFQTMMEEMHQTILSDYQSKIDSLRSALVSDFDQKIEAHLGSLQNEIGQLQVHVNDKIQKQSSEVDGFKEKVSAYTSKLRKLNSLNTASYQTFDRFLSYDDIQEFISTWSNRLGLHLDETMLGYLAHRICLVEDRCDGRLAASIQNSVLRCLAAKSLKEDELNVLEIGTLFGVDIGILHDTCKTDFETMHFTIIDPFDGYSSNNGVDPVTKLPLNRRTFEWNMEQLGIENVEVIQDFSYNEKELDSDEQFDLLIIDGDHSLFGVKTDFYKYSQLVKPGGYILFDDYGDPSWPDVKQFVDEKVADLSNLAFVGAGWNCAVFRMLPTYEIEDQKPAKKVSQTKKKSKKRNPKPTVQEEEEELFIG